MELTLFDSPALRNRGVKTFTFADYFLEKNLTNIQIKKSSDFHRLFLFSKLTKPGNLHEMQIIVKNSTQP
jgi:hypothetical protein